MIASTSFLWVLIFLNTADLRAWFYKNSKTLYEIDIIINELEKNQGRTTFKSREFLKKYYNIIGSSETNSSCNDIDEQVNSSNIEFKSANSSVARYFRKQNKSSPCTPQISSKMGFSNSISEDGNDLRFVYENEGNNNSKNKLVTTSVYALENENESTVYIDGRYSSLNASPLSPPSSSLQHVQSFLFRPNTLDPLLLESHIQGAIARRDVPKMAATVATSEWNNQL